MVAQRRRGQGDDTVAEQELEVTVERTTGSADAWPVVRVSGEVDIQSSPMLEETLLSVVDEGLISVMVDLEAVSFLDSTGLSVLIGALKRCQRAGGELRIRAPQANVLRVFEITGLTELFRLDGGSTGPGGLET
jgi:anti-sigma B factor antagonist